MALYQRGELLFGTEANACWIAWCYRQTDRQWTCSARFAWPWRPVASKYVAARGSSPRAVVTTSSTLPRLYYWVPEELLGTRGAMRLKSPMEDYIRELSSRCHIGGEPERAILKAINFAMIFILM